jgi:hypothetical protein
MTPTAELAARFLDAHEPRPPTDGEGAA